MSKGEQPMTGNFELPKMATINECAKIVKLAKYHIRQLVLQGKVKYVKAGKKYLINLNSLIEYLNNGETEAKTEEQDNNTNKIRKVGI